MANNIFTGDEDEWNARWRLNASPLSPQHQPQFVASFALIAAATRGDFLAVQEYLQKGADIAHDQCKAMRMAVVYGHYDIAKVLLEAGARPDVLNAAAMMAAAEKNDAKMIELLLVHKANSNHADAAALRRAASLGNTAAVMALVKGGADVFTTPFKPDTLALHCAEESGNAETAAFLESVMAQEKQKFLDDMKACENGAPFMRAPYATTSEAGLIRAVKMDCLDDALAKMKKSSGVLSANDLTVLHDREDRQLRYLAVTRLQLMKLFEPVLWANDIAAMQKAWAALPQPWFESGLVKQNDFDTIVAEHRQNILKSKAHKYKL